MAMPSERGSGGQDEGRHSDVDPVPGDGVETWTSASAGRTAALRAAATRPPAPARRPRCPDAPAACAGRRGLPPVAASACRATSRVARRLRRGSGRTGSTTRGATAAAPAGVAVPRRGRSELRARRGRFRTAAAAHGSGTFSMATAPPLSGPGGDAAGRRVQPVRDGLPWRIDFASRARLRNTAWKTSSASAALSTRRRAVPSTIGPWRSSRTSKARWSFASTNCRSS